MMITLEIKKQWVEALRSGKYSQTSGRLRRQDGFCCLGVLCDLMDTTKWIENPLNNWTYGEFESKNYDMLRGDLPITQKLINMNDTGKTFDQIADYIEENYNV